jgi:hypothetical protein
LDEARAEGTADVIDILARRRHGPVRCSKLPGEVPDVVSEAVARALAEHAEGRTISLTRTADDVTLLTGTAAHEARELFAAVERWRAQPTERGRREALAWCDDLMGTLRAGRVT